MFVIVLCLGAFLLLLVLGMPIVFTMGVASWFALLAEGDVPLVIMVQRLYAGANSWSFLAIPFFLLAGELMTGGALTMQLVRFTVAFFKYFPAGTGTVDVVASTLFAGISGSGTADMAAVGSVLIPRLIARGYPRGLAAALEAAAGALGPIIPPSMFMIIYAGIANVSVGRMFLGGMVPGLITSVGLILLLQAWNIRQRFEPREPLEPPRVMLKEMAMSTVGGLPALMIPVIIVGGIVSGVFTATESGAVAAVYALLVGIALRVLGPKEITRCFVRSASTTVRIMFPVTASVLIGWVLAREQFADIATSMVLSVAGGNSWLAAILVIAVIIILGFPIEGLTLMLVFAPILAPMGPKMGFDPIHWGILLVMCMNLAGITPPVGGGLFLVAGMAHASIDEMVHYLWPFLALWTVVILLCLFFPQTVVWFPNLVMPPR